MHKCHIRLLRNCASISLELCNKSIFRGFHILCSSLVARPHLSIRVCISVCHSLLLVYLFHLRICESFSTLLTLAKILHQIFVPLSSTSSTISLICVGVRNRQELVPIVLFPCYIIEWSLIHLQHRSRYIWYTFFSFSHSHISLGMMDRPNTSTNPLFIGQDNDMNSYFTKSHLFGA